jgi:hypothetical protein
MLKAWSSPKCEWSQYQDCKNTNGHNTKIAKNPYVQNSMIAKRHIYQSFPMAKLPHTL